ncbi:hypothetical protein Pan216_33740 [Planctomycetes bacterium Pan216]|uniref:Uncharacterized protein n=1 Tax=Kolteria novifilia TaxID=2527975 RepID=A0A518B6A5_9BACT|nr:hypothetical protein Pan216_33740 [Planctomycetes bacterium Pan216]
MKQVPESHPLRALFSGLTEQTFFCEMGVADTRLTDYLSQLLVRFIHRDSIYMLKGSQGRRLVEIAEMLLDADRPEHDAKTRREIFRHAGDVALFWSGVYPEALQRSKGSGKISVRLEEVFAQGKRSYYIASTYSDTPKQADEAPVLRRLSDDFEICAQGLRRVRSCWEHKGEAS